MCVGNRVFWLPEEGSQFILLKIHSKFTDTLTSYLSTQTEEGILTVLGQLGLHNQKTNQPKHNQKSKQERKVSTIKTVGSNSWFKDWEVSPVRACIGGGALPRIPQ